MKKPDYVVKDLNGCCPIVYRPEYDTTFFGLEKLSPFDPTRNKRVYEGLKNLNVINDQSNICRPSLPGREFLQPVMGKWYLLTLNYSLTICRITGLPLCFVPAWVFRWKLLDSF